MMTNTTVLMRVWGIDGRVLCEILHGNTQIGVGTRRVVMQTLFFTGKDSPLNPLSPHFKASAWAQARLEVTNDDAAAPLTAGVSFRNLDMYGFGETTDYLKEVARFPETRVQLR